MLKRHMTISTALIALLAAAPAAAQQTSGGTTGDEKPENASAEKAARATLLRDITIQHFRPQDQRGLNVFEPPKDDDIPWEGFRLELSAAFAQQFQSLSHENTAAPNVVDGTDQNELMEIGSGFNLATANLYVNVQLAPGIRVAMTTFLSSRHHTDTWVKDGYLLIDQSPLDVPALNTLMQYVTVKAGHFEINYGDAHFRRTDNANAFFNPFVGNYIMDSFTTEIGGEVYVRANGWLGMAALTGGEVHGDVQNPGERAPSFIGKLGFDRVLNPDLRLRLTGSVYTTSKSVSNTLYGGDRAGSRYYLVMENTQASTSSNFTSGRINPGFGSQITSLMVNPFVKVGGLELFGILEQAKGRASNEVDTRTWHQYAADAVYRLLPDEQLYVGARYNTVNGELSGNGADVSVDRVQLAGGWFVTPMLLLKAEYVTQTYNDFPTTDIRNGGKFHGFVVEGVVSF